MNYYVVLGIDEGADQETIRSAFRGLVRRYHPDVGVGASSDAFRAVVEAYDTLSDPARRRVYDRALQRNRVRSPARVDVVVEPLANRLTAEPIVSSRFHYRGYRRPAFVHVQVEVDEFVEHVFRSFNAGFWPIRRTRDF
jgi:curved DNA-binding protein CbpA